MRAWTGTARRGRSACDDSGNSLAVSRGTACRRLKHVDALTLLHAHRPSNKAGAAGCLRWVGICSSGSRGRFAVLELGASLGSPRTYDAAAAAPKGNACSDKRREYQRTAGHALKTSSARLAAMADAMRVSVCSPIGPRCSEAMEQWHKGAVEKECRARRGEQQQRLSQRLSSSRGCALFQEQPARALVGAAK
jgi:phage protein D